MVLDLLARLNTGQSLWSTESLAKLAGFALGLGLVAMLAWAVARACAKVPGLALKAGLTAALVVTALGHLTALTQILHGRRLVALPGPAFKALVQAVNHLPWVGYATLGLAAALAVTGLATAGRARHRALALAAAQTEPPAAGAKPPAAQTPPTPAAARLAKAATRRQRRYATLALAGSATAFALITGVAAWEARELELSPPEPLTIQAGEAVIPLGDVEDGHLHRFAYQTADGTTVRFIVIKKNGVAYGVGLDACEICGDTGYIERAGHIICMMCDVIMNVATIGFSGGCNPIPLDFDMTGGAIHIDLDQLEQAAPIFA
jgi:uncharacterized membrane protein